MKRIIIFVGLPVLIAVVIAVIFTSGFYFYQFVWGAKYNTLDITLMSFSGVILGFIGFVGIIAFVATIAMVIAGLIKYWQWAGREAEKL